MISVFIIFSLKTCYTEVWKLAMIYKKEFSMKEK